jgi:hypothetical protein
MLVDIAQSGAAGQLDLALSPEELGRVRLTMVTDGDTIRIMLQAERPETTELLRRHTEAFSAELQLAGFAGATFSFGRWGQSPDAKATLDLAEITVTPEAIPTLVATPTLNTGTGLDLRL